MSRSRCAASGQARSRDIIRRQCVNVGIACRMLSENFDGAHFVLRIPSPNPQQQTSAIQLLLQVMRMAIADPFGQNRANETADPARQCRRSDGSGKRAARSDDSPGCCYPADIHQAADQPALGVSDRLGRHVGRPWHCRMVRQRFLYR